MSVQIVLESHSTTEDNEAGLATGWRPGRLSAVGRDQAAELGRRRPAADFDAVYTSDLRRAVETARIAYPALGPVLRTDDRLRECDWGALTMRPVAELDAVRVDHVEEPFPGGQSYRDCVEAMRSFLVDVLRRHAGGRVLLVGHSAQRVALDHLLRGEDLAERVAQQRPWEPGWEYVLPDGWGG